MSLNGVFDEFDAEKKKDKTVPEEAAQTSKESDSEAGSIPEGEDETKEESEEEEIDDWFTPAEEEPSKDKPVEEQPVEEEHIKEEVAEEASAEETPASEVLAEAVDDWFEPTEEEPTGDKPAEDQSVEEEVAGETPIKEAPSEEPPTAETPAEATEVWFIPAEEEAPAEAPINEGIMPVGPSSIVTPAISPENMRVQIKRFQRLKASILDKGPHGDIATIQNKPYIKRSGWRKFALAFNIQDEILKEERDVHGDDFTWRFWVKATAPNGRSVVGVGACSSEEREFAHRRHDVYATAHTRAKNRALSDLIGSGEVSWEELRGFDSL